MDTTSRVARVCSAGRPGNTGVWYKRDPISGVTSRGYEMVGFRDEATRRQPVTGTTEDWRATIVGRNFRWRDIFDELLTTPGIRILSS